MFAQELCWGIPSNPGKQRSTKARNDKLDKGAHKFEKRTQESHAKSKKRCHWHLQSPAARRLQRAGNIGCPSVIIQSSPQTQKQALKTPKITTEPKGGPINKTERGSNGKGFWVDHRTINDQKRGLSMLREWSQVELQESGLGRLSDEAKAEQLELQRFRLLWKVVSFDLMLLDVCFLLFPCPFYFSLFRNNGVSRSFLAFVSVIREG